MAGKDCIESITEEHPIEACHRRNDRRAHRAPHTRHSVRFLQCEIRHAEEGLAEVGAANSTRNLIIRGRRLRFACNLPKRAAEERIDTGGPEAETGGSRNRVIDTAVVRMQELIHRKRVGIYDPWPFQIPANRFPADIESLVIAEKSLIETIQREVESDDFSGRDEKASLGFVVIGGLGLF